jgi:hypothetical protein
MVEDQNNDVHPIVQKVLQLAYKGFEPVEFDDYAIEQLEDMLKQYVGKPDLLKAVVDLINLAGILEEQGSHSASIKLLTALSSVADYLKSCSEEEK